MLSIRCVLPTTTVVIEVSPLDTVGDVKEKIADQQGFELDYFHLYFQGELLDTSSDTFLNRTGCGNDDQIECEISRKGVAIQKLRGREISCETFITEIENNGSLIESFIDSGLDVNFANKNLTTPLMAAPNKEIMLLLLSKGADPNFRTSKGRTAVMSESVLRNTSLLRVLHDNGSDLRLHSNSGYTSLTYAADIGILDSVKYILNTFKTKQNRLRFINQSTSEGTAIMLASFNDHTNVVSVLLDYGADPNKATKSGHTPLHCSTQNGNLEVTKMLIQKGAYVNVTSKDSFTPLINACGQSLDHVEYILNAGAAVVDDKKFPGIGYLCVHDSECDRVISIIKKLIAVGASPDAAWDENTALSCAASIGNMSYVKFLLSQGASISSEKGNHAQSPIHVACYNEREEVASYIIDYCNDNSDDGDCICSLHNECENGSTTLIDCSFSNISIELFTKILKHPGVNINFVSKEKSFTALSNAVNGDNLELVKLLLTFGSSVSQPAPILLYSQSVTMSSLLIEHGADPNAVIHHHAYPPGVVTYYQQYSSCITLLDVAYEMGCEDSIKLFEGAGVKRTINETN